MLNGNRTYITETTATVPESQVTGNLTIMGQTSNGFDVVVTNVSGGGKEVKEVRVPIWSDKNGQDDLTRSEAQTTAVQTNRRQEYAGLFGF